MDKILFGIIAVSAVSAVAAFVLGIIEGFWATLVICVIIVALLLALARRLPG